MSEPVLLVKPFQDEALGSASGDVLEPVEAVLTENGVSYRRDGPNLEVESHPRKLREILRNPAVNPEASTVYMEDLSPESGACPPMDKH